MEWDDEDMTLPRVVNAIVVFAATILFGVMIVWFGNATNQPDQRRYLGVAAVCTVVAIVGAGADYYLKHRKAATERQRGFPIVIPMEKHNET
ncbi:MAG TPA: hypothetical protein VGN72_07535 [Tepidisphaeraceae bacterium]|jgi:hypothetical protein|nr:hypothetical protein [Tepidisphaeraceae bacterium]